MSSLIKTGLPAKFTFVAYCLLLLVFSCFYQGKNVMLSKCLCLAALWNWTLVWRLELISQSWRLELTTISQVYQTMKWLVSSPHKLEKTILRPYHNNCTTTTSMLITQSLQHFMVCYSNPSTNQLGECVTIARHYQNTLKLVIYLLTFCPSSP